MQAEEQWQKLMRINPNMPSMQRLYSRFLSQVLHDREGGALIAQRMLEQSYAGTQQGYGAKRSVGMIDMASESR